MTDRLSEATCKPEYIVGPTESLTLERSDSIAPMYTLSPFVWRDEGGLKILLRLVPCSDNPPDKISRIHLGESRDGLHFQIGDEPVIAPGPETEDRDGCEDPTLVIEAGRAFVYYSGWNEAAKKGKMLMASGPDAAHLAKLGCAMSATKDFANPKEATLVPLRDGSWRLFFEYADEGSSKFGIASAPAIDGPWTILDPLFSIRAGEWDGYHLSPGPVLTTNPDRPVMFYNGSTSELRWRIGWIAFDAEYRHVVDRCKEPLFDIEPPEPGATDIAFAASCVPSDDGSAIWLYYSVSDKDLYRTTLRRTTNS